MKQLDTLEADSFYSALFTDTDATTVTFDLNKSNVHVVTVAASRILAFSNGHAGQRFTLVIRQDATGGWTVTWPASITWGGVNLPQPNPAANAITAFEFVQVGVGTTYYGLAVGQPADPSRADVRLTATTATPVTTADVTAATTLYVTPYNGNRVALYNAGWFDYPFSELALTPLGVVQTTMSGTLTISSPSVTVTSTVGLYAGQPVTGTNVSAGTIILSVDSGTTFTMSANAAASGAQTLSMYNANYDVFLYDNSGVVAVEKLGWTNNTTRATALVLQNNVYVKSGDPLRRYVGSYRLTGSTTTEDSAAKWYVWNAQNRVARKTFKNDATASWTSTGNGTFAAVNAASAVWKCEMLRGLDLDGVSATALLAGAMTNTSVPVCAVALDSATTIDRTKTALGGNGAATLGRMDAQYADRAMGLGYHYVQAVQTSSNTGAATFYGTNGGTVGAGVIGVNSGFAVEGWR